MKKLLFLIVPLLTSFCSFGQKPSEVLFFENDTFLGSSLMHATLDGQGNMYLFFNHKRLSNNPNPPTDVDFGPGVLELKTAGNKLIKYDQNLKVLWIREFDAGFYAEISLIENNRLYLTGEFKDSVDFNPNPNVSAIRSSLNKDSYFCLELDTSGNFIRTMVLPGVKNNLISNSPTMNVWHMNDQTFVFGIEIEDEGIDIDPGPQDRIEYGRPDSHWCFNQVLLRTDKNFNYLNHISIANDSFSFNFLFQNDTFYIHGTQTIDWHPNAQAPGFTLKSSGSTFRVLRYSKSLDFLGFFSPYQGEKYVQAGKLIKDGKGSYYISLNFRDTISIRPGDTAFTYVSAGEVDALVLRFENLNTWEPLDVYLLQSPGFERIFTEGFINDDQPLLRFQLYNLKTKSGPDLDPGPDSAFVELKSYGTGLMRLDERLNFSWAGTFTPFFLEPRRHLMMPNDSTLIVASYIYKEDNIDLDLSFGKDIYYCSEQYYNSRLFLAKYTFPKSERHTRTEALCQGDSLNFNNQFVSTAGVYRESHLKSNFQDSIINLELSINPTYHFFEAEDTVCYGNAVTWRNKSYTENGIYYDTLKTAHGCDSVFSALIPISKVDTTLKVVNTLLIAPQNQKSYTWVDCYANYAPIPNITVNGFTPPHGGIYAVIIENQQGCIDTSRCQEIRYVGLEEATHPDIKVYPNPFTDYITIEGLQPGDEVRVYDGLGRVVFESEPETKLLDFILQASPGVYLLEVTKKGASQRFKVIKK